MTLDIRTVPCLKDNYAYVAHDSATGATAVIDIPEAAPLVAVLKAEGWTLTHVLITHHHWDHVDGLDDLLATAPQAESVKIIGAAADKHRLPKLDIAVTEGDTIQIGAETGHIIDVSGHTMGHIAYHFPASDAVFTADSLMALGCGRLFEGTPERMWDSLSKLKALPQETIVYSGHEYTQSNAKFALTIEPDNPDLISRSRAVDAARTNGEPTVPSSLALELATNPFLRADDPRIAARLGMPDAAASTVFAEIRSRKDNF